MTDSTHILALATRAFAEQQIEAEISRISRPATGPSWLRRVAGRRRH